MATQKTQAPETQVEDTEPPSCSGTPGVASRASGLGWECPLLKGIRAPAAHILLSVGTLVLEQNRKVAAARASEEPQGQRRGHRAVAAKKGHSSWCHTLPAPSHHSDCMHLLSRWGSPHRPVLRVVMTQSATDPCQASLTAIPWVTLWPPKVFQGSQQPLDGTTSQPQGTKMSGDLGMGHCITADRSSRSCVTHLQLLTSITNPSSGDPGPS